MKTRPARSALGLALGIAAVLPTTVAPADVAKPTEWIGAEFVDAGSAEAAAVGRIGEAAINWLGARMVREVNNALAKGSPESAVAVCHLRNLGSPAGDVLNGMPAIKAIKRTSSRLLNPANAPDVAEQLVLDRVLRELNSDRPPTTTIVQKISTGGGGVEWRVYRPLVILPSCLRCHGDPAEQSPELQTLLRRGAAENPATGYRLGEWRGLLRVTVTPPARSGT